MLVSVSAVSLMQDAFAGSATVSRAVAACVVTLVFASVARLMRGVSRSGAIAGAIVSFLLYFGAGAGAFITLVALFLITLVATRIGYERKQRLGTAERGDGRTASQVLANLGIASACALLYAVFPNRALTLACVAALAEAAADTVSSEIGQSTTSTARLITSWKPVPAGTNGGISMAGTLAGIIAALLIAVLGCVVRLIAWQSVGIPLAAAVAGMFFDSLLGATLERRSLLNNDSVNFLSTLAAAMVAAGTTTLIP